MFWVLINFLKASFLTSVLRKMGFHDFVPLVTFLYGKCSFYMQKRWKCKMSLSYTRRRLKLLRERHSKERRPREKGWGCVVVYALTIEIHFRSWGKGRTCIHKRENRKRITYVGQACARCNAAALIVINQCGWRFGKVRMEQASGVGRRERGWGVWRVQPPSSLMFTAPHPPQVSSRIARTQFARVVAFD